MKGVYFIVGPTATGKSAIAGEVARICNGEVVGADAFQIYAGFDLLTAKPEASLLHRAPHHLIGAIALTEQMNAERFRAAALAAIEQVRARGKPAFVVGGSGMYVKALTHGLSQLPETNPALRERLGQYREGELLVRLRQLDPQTARSIDSRNKRRLVRAVEICLLTGRPVSTQRRRSELLPQAAGVFLFRDRAELYERIDARVEMMFADGVIDEVRFAGELGQTAGQMLGLQQIRALIAGRISKADCIASIQQATRRYAKRQLTWFQRQTTFEPLNLSLHGSEEAIEWISRKARLSFSQPND